MKRKNNKQQCGQKVRHYNKLPSFFFVFFLLVHIDVACAAAGQQAITPQSVLAYINQERLQSGLAPLEMNARLQIAAEDKILDMTQRRYFAHSDPDGHAPWMWVDGVGYEYTHAGENLAIGFIEPKSQHEAWMNSEFHRRNILNTDYTETGIAVMVSDIRETNEIIVVQFFGRPTVVTIAKQTPSAVRGVQFAAQESLGAAQYTYQEDMQSFFVDLTHRSVVAFQNMSVLLRSYTEVWRALLMTLLVVQFSISFAVASRIYVHMYKKTHTIDLQDAIL